MADDLTEFNDDDFEEYNPHPYLGGYDIALTYGPPLPPSSAICYPISTSAAPSSESAVPVIRLPTIEPERRPSHPPSPPITSAYDYGLPENHRPEPFLWSDLFTSWPYANHEDLERYGGSNVGVITDSAEGYGFSNWPRCLDYLFGHAEGYGEQIIGADSYGVPIYASKKHAAQSILVEVEPAPVQRLNFYGHSLDEQPDSANNGGWLSSVYKESRDENLWDYGAPLFAQNRHESEQLPTIKLNPNENLQHERLNYFELYSTEQAHYNAATANAYQPPLHSKSNSEMKLNESFFCAYDQDQQEQTIYRQVMTIEPSWSQIFRYDNGYQELPLSYHQVSPYHDKQLDAYNSLRGSSYEDEKRSYQLDDHVPFEPFNITWPKNLDHNEAYQEEMASMSKKKESYDAVQQAVSSIFDWQSSLCANQDDKGSMLDHIEDEYKGQHHEKFIYDQLEPYKPTWSQYASSYENQNQPITDYNLFQHTPERFQYSSSLDLS